MSFKLRGIPEWLASVEGDETYTDSRTFAFTDTTNNRTFICKGSQAWLDSNLGTKFVITWGNKGGTFTDSVNTVNYVLTRTHAYIEGAQDTLFEYKFSRSFKELEKELDKLKAFTLAQGANFSSSTAGRPFICMITNSTDSPLKDFFSADEYKKWESSTSATYQAVIKYTSHKKGFIRSESGFYPDEIGWEASTAKALIVPQVKTYSLLGTASAGNITFEEVYDSATINVQTGDVTLYSDLDTPAYLVLIY